MRYHESKLIESELEKAGNILLKVHRSPDPDSVASCLSMSYFLKKNGKNVDIISSDPIQENLFFLKEAENIKKVDMSTFDYSKYDLFVVLDASSLDQSIGIKDANLPEIPLIVIDHHITNKKYGKINLVDYLGSTCEVLYHFFQDLNFDMDRQLALYLLTGIISDTGSFQFDYTTTESLEIASELIKKGADRQEIVYNLFNSYKYDLVKFWGVLLDKMELNKECQFVWTAIPYETYMKYNKPAEAKSLAATLFFSSIYEADFGIVMVEQTKGILNLSLRSRRGVDVSKIANELGGSGHREAAGGWFKFDNFNSAVEKVLNTAKKYAKKS